MDHGVSVSNLPSRKCTVQVLMYLQIEGFLFRLATLDTGDVRIVDPSRITGERGTLRTIKFTADVALSLTRLAIITRNHNSCGAWSCG